VGNKEERMSKIASHVRAHFVAYLALFFALGGTSFAAVNALPRNSVGSPQIKNRSIQKVDISKRTVAALHGARGARGPAGPTGATGATGAKGDKGDPGTPNPNADSLNGFPATGLVRSAYASASPGTAVGGTTVTLVTANITAPTAGFLTVGGQFIFDVSTLSPLIHCGFSVDGSAAWIGDDGLSSSVIVSATGPNPCGRTTRFPVAAGPHSVALQAHNDGSGAMTARGGSVSVVFEPFGSAGATGTGSPTARPAGTDLNG
jgi:hypothetical protein